MTIKCFVLSKAVCRVLGGESNNAVSTGHKCGFYRLIILFRYFALFSGAVSMHDVQPGVRDF